MYNVLHRGFVFSHSPTAMCHGSTVLPLSNGTVLSAWFGGSYEGKDDTGIWCAVRKDGGWSAPRPLAQGEEPHWNPVLLEPEPGRILLFYKVGRDISRWRTMVRESRDQGTAWSAPRELVPGDRGGRGPVRCKPIRLASGRLLAPASAEDGPWRAFADRSDDGGATWTKSGDIGLAEAPSAQGKIRTAIPVSDQSLGGRGVIQPTLWESGPDRVHMLLRSTQGRIYRSDSTDGGVTWRPAYATDLPNNNSGIDLAALPDGSLALAYNPVGENWGPRTPMRLSLSRDNGASWQQLLDLDSGLGEFAYPAVTARGHTLHLTYTWKRRSIAYWQIEMMGAQPSHLPSGDPL